MRELPNLNSDFHIRQNYSYLYFSGKTSKIGVIGLMIEVSLPLDHFFLDGLVAN